MAVKIAKIQALTLNFVKKGLDSLLPPRCIMTGQVVERQGALAPEAWNRLAFIGHPLCQTCGMPFPFDAGPHALCGACLAGFPAYDRARAALVYDDASRDFILRFKHADQVHAVHSFVPWLQRAGVDMLADADFLIPVPLHRWRLLKRRYNQAALMARTLGKASDTSCLPDALLRHRATPVQGHLNFAERRKNVRHAFSINPKHANAIKDRRIVLIDDVLTTGATAGECARILKKAGAASVDVLALARVVKAE